jgi:endonuclease/exonuclease/phosphatase family metal-dependent hydrolase
MNIAGGARAVKAHPRKFACLARAIREMACDVVAVQEVLAVVAADGRMVYNTLRDEILPHLPDAWDWFFYAHLDSWQHSAIAKWARAGYHPIFGEGSDKTALRACMARSGIPAGEWESRLEETAGTGGWWMSPAFRVQEGSAIAVRQPWGFKDLLDSDCGNWVSTPRTCSAPAGFYAGSRYGHGVILPWYLGDDACFYLGDRDTTPRSLLMARLGCATDEDDGPELLLGCTHLAALGEENVSGDGRLPTPRAVALRERQVACLNAYMLSCQDAMSPRAGRLTAVLAGDFNCTPQSPELRRLRESGFSPLPLTSQTGGPVYTHRRHRLPIDLILTPAPVRASSGAAIVYDLGQLEAEGIHEACSSEAWISDHHPVWARVDV